MPESTDRLMTIFRAVFNLPAERDVRALEQENTPAWDSLAHVSLVTAIESEFGIGIDAADQLEMTGFAATAKVLEKHGL